MKDENFHERLEGFFEGLVGFLSEVKVLLDTWDKVPRGYSQVSELMASYHEI